MLLLLELNCETIGLEEHMDVLQLNFFGANNLLTTFNRFLSMSHIAEHNLNMGALSSQHLHMIYDDQTILFGVEGLLKKVNQQIKALLNLYLVLCFIFCLKFMSML